jgi:hypothetical protein
VGSLDAKCGSATTPAAVDTMDAAKMLSLAAPARFGLNAKLEMTVRWVPLSACGAGGRRVPARAVQLTATAVLTSLVR